MAFDKIHISVKLKLHGSVLMEPHHLHHLHLQ